QFLIEDKVIATDRQINDHLGHHGPVSIDGNIAVGGAHFANGSGLADAGEVYIFRWDEINCDWIQTDEVVAFDAEPNAQFGRAVSYQNGVLVVGAPTHDQGGLFNSGNVYVYNINIVTGTATFLQTLD